MYFVSYHSCLININPSSYLPWIHEYFLPLIPLITLTLSLLPFITLTFSPSPPTQPTCIFFLLTQPTSISPFPPTQPTCIFSLSSLSFSACFLSLSSLFRASWLLGTGLKVRSVRVQELNSPRFQWRRKLWEWESRHEGVISLKEKDSKVTGGKGYTAHCPWNIHY